MKIIVFDHTNELLLSQLAQYNLPIETQLIDLKSLYAKQQLTNDITYYVSPANSFGFMNGGIDAVYCELWPEVETKVRESIIRQFEFNEILIGQFDFITLDIKSSLVVAPTMRTPDVIRDPSVIYLATRAAVRFFVSHAERYEPKTGKRYVLCMPGMGTGVGKVHPILAARNMALGIKHGLEGVPAFETCVQTAVQSDVLRKL